MNAPLLHVCYTSRTTRFTLHCTRPLLSHPHTRPQVSYERTKALMDGFDPSCLSEFTHDGAHLVPTCTGAFKAVGTCSRSMHAVRMQRSKPYWLVLLLLTHSHLHQ